MPSRTLDLQRLWLAVARKSWPALIVLPVEPGTRVNEVVAPMAEFLGGLGPPGGFRLMAAEGVLADAAGGMAVEIQDELARGVRVVVSTDSPAHNPAVLPLLRVCSAALLVVELGVTRTESVATLLELVGEERVLGCVAVQKGVLPVLVDG
ncbi:MAG: hypothetical protein QM765_09235 [Myxococcales bacterium]